MTQHTEQEVKPCEFVNGACVNCEATEQGDCEGYVCNDSLYANYTKRPWQGLTDEDFLEACQLAEHGNYLVAFQRIQTKLKERNT